jgi:acetoin utilization deacetylase AcuC-like enzyme
LLVSAGYDAHGEDPLGQCDVTEDGFAAMTRAMRRVGEALDAPVGCVLEGGYALGALARSVAATLAALQEPVSTDGTWLGADGASSPVVDQARERLSEWWPALG